MSSAGLEYTVAFRAKLVVPYFVSLRDPIALGSRHRTGRVALGLIASGACVAPTEAATTGT